MQVEFHLGMQMVFEPKYAGLCLYLCLQQLTVAGNAESDPKQCLHRGSCKVIVK